MKPKTVRTVRQVLRGVYIQACLHTFDAKKNKGRGQELCKIQENITLTELKDIFAAEKKEIKQHYDDFENGYDSGWNGAIDYILKKCE